MEYHINIFNVLIAFAMLQGFAFSGILLFKSKLRRSNFYLGLTVFFLSSYLFWVLKYDFGIQAQYPKMQFLPVLFLWGIGPAFYLYLREIFGEDTPSGEKKKMFVPLLLEQAYFNGCTLIVYRNEGFQFSNLSNIESAMVLNVFSVEHIIGLISIAYYLVKSYSLLKRHNVLHTSNKIRNILIVLAALWVVWVPFTLIDIIYYDFGFPPSRFYAFYIVFAGLTYGIGFLGFRITEKTVENVALKKHRNVDKELEALADLVTKAMEGQKLYLNQAFDLKTLAEEVNLHPNKVSAIINQILGMSFRDFVNSYRISEFKERSQSYDFSRQTILGLAFECGFNSKASFNRAFRKSENCSPAEYLSNK